MKKASADMREAWSCAHVERVRHLFTKPRRDIKLPCRRSRGDPSAAPAVYGSLFDFGSCLTIARAVGDVNPDGQTARAVGSAHRQRMATRTPGPIVDETTTFFM
jgi:hypothetical protein